LSVDPLHVVFVCTGNRFRSPLAAALFEQAAAGLPVDVSSAGTLDLGGVGALPEAESLATALGVDLSSHRSRAVTDAPLSDADLVLGFERAHVVTAVVDGGAPRDRTFTLPELATLLTRIEPPPAGDPAEYAREVIRRAARARPKDDPQLMAVPELRDPLGLPHAEQLDIARRVRELVAVLHAGLFG
jgi:protein-tyrosine phosphatase